MFIYDLTKISILWGSCLTTLFVIFETYQTNRSFSGATKNEDNEYMLVIKDSPNLHYCKSCYGKSSYDVHFCIQCRKQTFAHWNSGNEDIDEIIRTFQLRSEAKFLKWVPFSHFAKIKRNRATLVAFMKLSIKGIQVF